MAQTHKPKTPEDRSEKAHMPMPPKDVQPKGGTMEQERGEAGQFTDRGAPGLGKR